MWCSTIDFSFGSSCRSVARSSVATQVAMDRVEEPERGVRRVVEPLLGPFREHVRNQAVAHVVPERAQDVARLALAARAERQPFEADHRVAAPVGEPVVAGDDGAHFVAGRAGARRFLDATCRRDDELVGGQHQLRRNPVRAARAAPMAIRRVRRCSSACGSSDGVERADRLPRLGRRDQRARARPARARTGSSPASRDRRSIRSRGSARARRRRDRSAPASP